jgi:CubicO group peptidase (beta-lactamase class C family)
VRHFTDESQYGWVLVSAAIEATADQPFLTFMREQVFHPLAMNDTGAESAKEENPQAIGEPAEDPPPFTLIRAVFLKPLGLGGTKVWSRTPRMSNYYFRGFGPDPVVGYGLRASSPRNLSCYAGAMAFFSTPSDLVRFGLATQLPLTSYDGDLPGGKVASLILIRERGIVVAVTSNIAGADTSALALNVAEAFAD